MSFSRIQSYASATVDDSVLPVAIISLDDHSERRSEVNGKGIPSEWVKNYWPATDFRNVELEAMKQRACLSKLESHLGRGVRSGEIGCALSHNDVACWLSDSGHDLMLVLEDDAIPLIDNFEELALSVANTLEVYSKKGAAFVCLLSLEREFVQHALRREVRKNIYYQLNGMKLFLHSDPDAKLWRAHAYLLSRGGAERVQIHEEKIRALADDWHFRRKLRLIDKIFYLSPVVFGIYGELNSSIDGKTSRRLTKPQNNEQETFSHWTKPRATLRRIFSGIQRRYRRVKARILSAFPLSV